MSDFMSDVFEAIASAHKDAKELEDEMEGIEPHAITVQRKRSALRTMLAQMDVPEMRRDTSQRTNIHWLNRNLQIQNSEHPMFSTARGLIRWLLKEGVSTSRL